MLAAGATPAGPAFRAVPVWVVGQGASAGDRRSVGSGLGCGAGTCAGGRGGV